MMVMVFMEFDHLFENDSDNGSDFDMLDPCNSFAASMNSTWLMSSYIVVFLLSLLGNSLVIYVICCTEKRKTSTDVYLMNLALADLLFSLTLPFWAVYVHSQWVFGNVLCKLLSGLQEATFYSGVLLLACISVDRYLAIVKATQSVVQKRHLVGVVCGGVWLGAAFLSLPVLIQREVFQPHGQDGLKCYDNLDAGSMDKWRVGMSLLRNTVGFFLPLAVMVFCYSLTTCTLYRTRSIQKHKAMRVILSVVLAFVICWLPFTITVLVDIMMRGELLEETCGIRDQVDLTLEATRLLAFLHCAINPILYAFIGQKFRYQLLTVLFKHGLINKRVLSSYRKDSIHSFTSQNTTITQ